MGMEEEEKEDSLGSSPGLRSKLSAMRLEQEARNGLERGSWQDVPSSALIFHEDQEGGR